MTTILRTIILGSMLVMTALPAQTTVQAEEKTATSSTVQTLTTNETNRTNEEQETDSAIPEPSIDSESKEPAETAEKPEEVVAAIEEDTGIKSGNAEGMSDAASIRNVLLNDQFGIDKAELDAYSDEQLENAMTLFDRYNRDFYGMDPGGYVRVLQALYNDQTLSWEKISGQLAFNPEEMSYKDLIDNIDALQAYLAALYPESSSAIGVKKLTNDALTEALTYLDETVKGEMLNWPGKIARISRVASDGIPVPTENSGQTDAKETGTTTTTTTEKQQTASDKKGKLPQAGENRNIWLVGLGGIIIIGVAAYFVMKKKKP